jgi:nucleoside-diphosphate-sugar epimerase
LGLATEEAEPHPDFPRKSEQAGLAALAQSVRAIVIRLPPSVHGDGDHGFVPALIQQAREKGSSIYVGEGQNLWAAGHRLDVAKLYRLALEKGSAGSVFHGVGDEGIPTRQIAEIIARRVNVPAVSKTPDEAAAMLGFIGRVLAMGGLTSSRLTQERLGWKPTHLGLLEDLEQGTYFDR